MNPTLVNYERFADSIKLQSSRNDFVNKLMVLDPSNPEITKNTTFPDTIKNNEQVIALLKQKVDELVQAERENLSINTSDALNQEDAKEIEKLRIILKGLKAEEEEVNSKINERKQYKQKLLDQAQDIKSGIQLLRPKTQNKENSAITASTEVTSSSSSTMTTTNIPDAVELQQKIDK